MRVLVTGGSGFVGRHVTRRLLGRHDVLAPSHGELDLADADAVRRWLAANPVDAVVHTAVKPGHRNAPAAADLAEQNLRQFFALVRCRQDFGRFVVLTSGAVYGVQRSIAGIAEDELGEVVPADAHGFAKYVEALWLAHDRDAVELRPFGVYGRGEDYAIRFISNACCKALLGMPVTLRRDRLFSYVWVEDLAAVVEASLGDLAGGPTPGAYNVAPHAPFSLLELARLVVKVSGRDVPIVVGDDQRGLEYSGDGSRLAAVVPSLAFTIVENGVRQLLDWYAARLDSLDRSVLETDR